jgi:hypothetical protein
LSSLDLAVACTTDYGDSKTNNSTKRTSIILARGRGELYLLDGQMGLILSAVHREEVGEQELRPRYAAYSGIEMLKPVVTASTLPPRYPFISSIWPTERVVRLVELRRSSHTSSIGPKRAGGSRPGMRERLLRQ